MIIKKKKSPIPRSDEMLDRTEGAKLFSKSELKTGFHQTRVNPEDVEKKAFNTKYGKL